jgi:hypothetical protein
MATEEQLLEALRRADAAGDVPAAQAIAKRIQETRAAPEDTGPALSQEEAREGMIPSAGDIGERVGRFGREVRRQFFKQTGGLALLPVEIGRAFADKLGGDPVRFGELTQGLEDKIDDTLGTEPMSGEKRAARAGVATAIGAVAPGSAMRNAATALASNVGEQVGEEVGRQSGGEYGGIMGGGIGSLAPLPTLLAKGRGTHQQMLVEALRGLKQGDFREATRVAGMAKDAGIDLTPEQLFSQRSGLDTLVDEVLRSGKGGLQERVFDQPQQATVAALRTRNQAGPEVDASTAVRELRESADNALESEGLGKAGRRLYDYGDARVGQATLDDIDTQLRTLEEGVRGSDALTERIRALRKQVAGIVDTTPGPPGPAKVVRQEKGAAKFLQVPGEPTKVPVGARAEDLDRVVKEAQATLADLKRNTPGLAKLQTGQMAGAIKALEEALNYANPARPVADDLFKSALKRKQSAESSLTGRIAGRQGVDPAAPDSLALIKSTLGSDRNSTREIGELGSTLRDQSERLKREAEKAILPGEKQRLLDEAARVERSLPQAVRTLMDEAWSASQSTAKGGRVDEAAGASFAGALIGTPNKEANFRKLLESTAVVGRMGTDPKAYADGMINTLKVISASARNRGGTQFAKADIAAEAGDGVVRKGFRLTQPLARTQVISEGLRNIAYARQYKQLAKIFTSPDAVAQLERIGRTPVVSSRMGALISTLLTGASTEGEQDAP